MKFPQAVKQRYLKKGPEEHNVFNLIYMMNYHVETKFRCHCATKAQVKGRYYGRYMLQMALNMHNDV